MEDGGRGAAIRARRKVREEKEKEAGALRQGREAGAAFWTLPAPGAGH